MRGLLADVNVQGHARYLHQLMISLPEWELLTGLDLSLATFEDLQLPPDLDDRALWNFCQSEGWVLFTENRNQDGPDSLERTLRDSWQEGRLPILTLANKRYFERSRQYALEIAADVAEVLFGISEQRYRDQPRIYLPLIPRKTSGS